MIGEIYCLRNSVLEVEKYYESRNIGGILQIRCYSYRYFAYVRGGHKVLRYHNIHVRDDDYHHRVFDPLTGEQVGYEKLQRYQFPTLSLVLDEMEVITRPLESER